MSHFVSFSTAVNRRLRELSTFDQFYLVDFPGIFQTYLASFPHGTDPMFRQRTTHDCQCCRQFIENLGKMVVVENGVIETVWGNLGRLPAPYDQVALRLDAEVKSKKILGVFRTDQTRFGTESNRDSKSEITWNHFYGHTPSRAATGSPAKEVGLAHSAFSVLKRGLDQLRIEDTDDVLDLIENSNSIYRGEEHLDAIQGFRTMLLGYSAAGDKELFVWENIGSPFALFRNTVIGTLFVDLAEMADLSQEARLERAITSFEKKSKSK